MKKFDNPFGIFGSLKIGAVYAVGDDTYAFSMDGAGNASDSRHADWQSFDSVVISVAVEYDLFNPVGFTKGDGKFGFKAIWKPSFSDDGLELALDGAQPKMLGGNKGAGDLVVAASVVLGESKAKTKKPFVEMVVTMGAGSETEGVQVGLQAGPLSLSTTVGSSKGSTQREFSFKLALLTDQPARQAPPPNLKASLLEPAPMLFENEDQDSLSSLSIKELHAWVSKIKDEAPQLESVIAQGNLPIEIQAFASTTGSTAYDKKKTDQRADAVKNLLKKAPYFNSSKIMFDTQSHGKSKAENKGAKHSIERRVEIRIDRSKAAKAIQQLTSGP